jgi:hypothetical protein
VYLTPKLKESDYQGSRQPREQFYARPDYARRVTHSSIHRRIFSVDPTACRVTPTLQCYICMTLVFFGLNTPSSSPAVPPKSAHPLSNRAGLVKPQSPSTLRPHGYIGQRGISLSGSYQQGYSTTYNTQLHIKVVCNGYILTHISNYNSRGNRGALPPQGHAKSCMTRGRGLFVCM